MTKSTPIALVIIPTVIYICIAAAGPPEDASGQPDSEACMTCHDETYKEWKSSKHAVTANSAPVELESQNNEIGCKSCHTPHDGSTPSNLIMESKLLCETCHAQQRAVLQGKGAKGIEETRSMHSSIACTGCHMTGGSHRMKVLRPDDPDLPEDRTDSCTACHKDNGRKIRAAQIKDFHKWYRDALDPLQEELKAIDMALKEQPDLLNDDLKAKLSDIKSNLSIIINDGSEGIHNLDYALEIMALAKRELAGIKAVME